MVYQLFGWYHNKAENNAQRGNIMYQYVRAHTVALGIEEAMKALNAHGIAQERENQDWKDVTTEIQLLLDIEEPNAEPAISRSIITDLKGLAQYDREFLDGTADDAGWEYTYHKLYSRFYNQLLAELRRNINTRRACIAMGQGDINFSQDPPCMQMLMFNHVDGKLEMTVIFRSNDGVKAFPMNIHACAMLQQRVADEMELPVGPLHYIANNFHCYSRDREVLKNYCKTFETANEKRRFYSLEQLKQYL